ncbi:MAG: 2-C-methyl-D-erythritol 4-phosphate cytidylyltransferase, partial [Butyricicoccaceae bacterium]
MFEWLHKKREKEVYAVLPAAGSSNRMGGGNKLLMEVDGVPVLRRTLTVFEETDIIDGIVLACREQDVAAYRELTAQWGITKVRDIV